MRLNMSGKPTVEFRSEQDVTDILDINQALYNQDNFSGSLWDGNSMVLVAQIPYITLDQWAQEDDINFMRWNEEDKAKIIKRLNDPSWKKLRTAPGRI
jgi:hypothetical protein